MNVDTALLDHPLKISEVNTLISATLKQGFYNLALEGEISGFKPSTSGHFYFSLKDEKSKISAVMFKSRQYNLNFSPQNGDLVTVYGNIEVYVPYGTYQIVIDKMVKQGEGDLLAQMEKLKQYYQNLGYFDPQAKLKIPKYPKRLVVITAPTGAAIRDVLQITGRRAPSLDIIILPTLVQGESAPETIAKRIYQADDFQLGDLIIVGRGGGSVEDLSCFSTPPVIEAIHNCSIPVISAVGHENDWALSDYVADLRASTPSAAAELATAFYYEVLNKLESANLTIISSLENKINKAKLIIKESSIIKEVMNRKVNDAKLVLTEAKHNAVYLKGKLNNAYLAISAFQDSKDSVINSKLVSAKSKIKENKLTLDTLFKKLVETKGQEIKNAKTAINYSFVLIVKDKKAKLEKEKTKLETLNPYSVLKRGYSILQTEDGKIIKDAKMVKSGDILIATLNKGKLNLQNIGDKT